MKAWRQLGFVQDSDDEGEELSEESQNREDEQAEEPHPARRDEASPSNTKDAIQRLPASNNVQDLNVETVRGQNMQVEGDSQEPEELGVGEVGGKEAEDQDDWDELQMDDYPAQISGIRETAPGPQGVGSERRAWRQPRPIDSGPPQLPSIETTVTAARVESPIMAGPTRHLISTLKTSVVQPHSISTSTPHSPQRRSEVQVVISPQRVHVEENVSEHGDWEDHNVQAARSLRERRPIQMHPYALEQQKYRQTMQARGVRPIQVLTHSQRDAEKSDQEQERDSSSQSVSPVPVRQRSQSTGQTSMPSSPPPNTVKGLGSISDDDESLPDLETLLKRSAPVRASQHSNKRRKIQKYSSKVQPTARYLATNHPRMTSPSTVSPGLDIFDVPPSPAKSTHSSNAAPQHRANGFRYPPGFQAPRLPTPATSSNSNFRPNHPLHAIGPHADTPSPLATRQTVLISDDSSEKSTGLESDSSSGSEASDQVFKGIKKKIKGVLPASWLKLDLKSRSAQAKRKRSPIKIQTVHQDDSEQNFGVAQKRSRASPRPSSPPSPVPIVNSSDSESESDGTPFNFGNPAFTKPMTRPAELSPPPPYIHLDEDPGCQMEDDFIDSMGPSTSRPYQRSKSGPKRQSKWKDAFLQSAKRTKIGKTSYVPKQYQTASRKPQGQTSSRPRRNLPRLNIVDAMADTTLHTPHVPQFLKIAARQSCRQPNQGRQSPTRKHILLQTRQDTEDANAVLSHWRCGKIRQRSSPQQSNGESRPPFIERESNSQQILPGKSFHLPHLTRKARGSTQPAARMYQTRLSPMTLPKSRQLQPNASTKVRSRFRVVVHKSSRLPQAKSMPAQLEAEELESDSLRDRLQFRDGIRHADCEFAAQRHSTFRNPQLELFLSGTRPDRITPLKGMMPHENQSKLQRKASPHKASAHNLDASLLVRHNPRKIRARRLDVETSDYRQPIGLPSLATRRSASAEFFPSGQPTLQDLGPFGAHFTTDFDVFPLPMDTYFHDTTLIGSGEFGRAISMVHRSFDVSHGRHIIVHAGRSCAWAQWTDEMATFLHETFGALIARLEDQLPLEEANLDTYAASSVLFLRRIIKANSDTLSFFDPVDRVSCVERFLDVLEPLSAATLERLSSFQALPGKQNLARLLFRALSLQLVLTRQLFAIAQQTISSSTIDSRISSIVLDVSTAVLRYLNDQVFDQVREFLNQNQRRAVREGGIRDEAPAIEAIVMLWHTLKSLDIPGASFWSIINTVCSSGVKDTIKSGTLERKWYNIFTVLPLLEFDNNGLLRAGQRFQEPHDNWEMIRLLLSRVFTLYPATSAIPGSNVNKYMRSLLARCHQLIRGWGWHRCELIIGLIFDFFARNKLAPLQNEVISKSPLFLEILDQHPNLEISLEDSSFHIFLKILGTGLQGMRNIYTEKKITSIAWRCIPNHGRSYRNDEELHPEDLVALRNNHDLLCTLYWASPPKSRPRIDTIHNLVEHSTSQRAACRLNIKAWANLVKFQLSTKEPTETLEPFAVWFNDIVEQTISLYKLAPSEAQEAYEKARKEGNTSLSAGDLMRTVSRNQSNVLASLVDAAVGLRNSLPSASSPINAAYLLEKTNISHIFGLFGLFKPRANPCIIEVLHVYSAFLDLQSKHISSHASRIVNEESQDYGDWPDPEVNAEGANRQPESPEIVPHDFTFGPLAQLLSTCFGAESSPEDALLSTLVDTWTKLALYSVQTKQKDWGIFLDNYSAHSWSSLRATEQTRKYGPYFLAKLAELDKDTLLNNRTHFLSAWLTSLVERDSRLKFQNQLTTTLLKVNSEDVLLQNLPFVAASRDRILAIPLAELRERRLALLSSILSNMRNHFHDTIRNNPHVVQEVRSEYASFLKQMMAAMKTNFHELQQEETIVRGTYVEFVHKLVEFLQEYTSDICPVDPFFTDSNIFPLPANDPKYVVGRLKGYGAKFADPKVMKQLASFLLNVSSRAAIDGEQSYLTEQLTTAMSSTYETGDSARPTLRNMLLQGIFPSYIQASITTPCGWILARPILHACANMFSGFMYDFSATNQGSSDAALQLLSTTLFTLRETISVLSIHPEHLQHSHVLRTVAAIFRVVTSMMPSLDYILRHTKHDTTAVENIVYFKMLTVFVAQTIFGHADTNPPSDPEEQTQIPVTYAEIRNFCHKQLDDLSKTWKRDGDHYYVRLHGSDWKVVEVGIRTIGQERDDVIIAIEEFHTVLGRMKALGNSHS